MNEIEKGFKKAGDFLDQLKKQFGIEFKDPQKWLDFSELMQSYFKDPWIPVGERLPYIHQYVLGHMGEINACQAEVYWTGKNWECSRLGGEPDFKITHWQPLPKQPKGE